MKKPFAMTAAAILAATLSTSALAASNFYGSIGYQQSRFDASAPDRNGPGLRVMVGHPISSSVGLEAFFAENRHQNLPMAGKVKTHETGLALVYHHPLSGPWYGLAKAGVSHTRLKSDTLSSSQNDWLAGVGVTYRINPQWAARAELEHSRNFADTREGMNKFVLSAVRHF